MKGTEKVQSGGRGADMHGLFTKGSGRYYVRRAVPPDLTKIQVQDGQKLGYELVRSLKTTDLAQAKMLRNEFWRETDILFREARARLAGTADATLSDVLTALDRWRGARVATAAQGGTSKPVKVAEARLPRRAQAAWRAGTATTSGDLNKPSSEAPTIRADVVAAARAYLDAVPERSRDLGMPFDVARLLDRLPQAAAHPDGWRQIEGFDGRLDEAAREGGLSAPIPMTARRDVRQHFAQAWLEVVQHEEWGRQRAAAVLLAWESGARSPGTVQVAPAPAAYIPHAGDKTIGEVVAAFKAERIARYGDESTVRKYHHIFEALTEALGTAKPIRGVTREDAKAVRELLRELPKHMGKGATYKHPDGRRMTLAEAAAKRRDIGAPAIAPNTLNTYLGNLSAVFRFAVDEGWAETNVATKLAGEKRRQVKRRRYETSELKLIFGALARERTTTPWRWWVFSLALYTGARLNEICQLRRADVRHQGGINYLSLSEFDETGRRVEDARLKTKESARDIPLHPDLVSAGFLDFVAGCTTDRLFPELKPGPSGLFSHDASKWWGRFMDKLDLKDPSLVAHSFRHGLRDAGRRAGLPYQLIDALGGWAAANVAEGYGERGHLEVLQEAVRRIAFDDFTLAAFPDL